MSEPTMDKDYFDRNADGTGIIESDDGTGTSADPSSSKDSGTLSDAIRDNATGPKRVQGDSGSVEQHSLQDQIAAEKFLQSKKAAQGKGFPVRIFKISPDGTT